MPKKVWIVIEKNNYGENNNSYSVIKDADTIEQATTYKVHLDALNDRKNRTYFIVSDIDTVLESVCKHHNESVENGTYYDLHPEIKKPEVKKSSEEEMPF